MSFEIINADCLKAMADMPDNSVDAIVTDPPYGLKFMGKKWDYDVPSIEVWQEALRVLKHGGHLLCACGTRTQHRMVCNIEDAGFEIRDVISWIYGSGFPKSLSIGKAIDKEQGNERKVIGKMPNPATPKQGTFNCSFDENKAVITAPASPESSQYEGWGTALKPACEFWTLARKPLEKGLTVAQNVLKWGTGGINIDGCRVGERGKEQFTGVKKPHLLGGGVVYGDYNYPKSETPLPAGRFPANIIHDGSDEVLAGFPMTGGSVQTQKNISLKRQDNKIYGKGLGMMNPNNTYSEPAGSASRFFYCAKASKKDRDEGCEDMELKTKGMSNQYIAELKRGNDPTETMKKSSGMSLTHAYNFHPTVKPTALMRYLCRLVTPPNGIVLDPFMGSGSTGKGAVLEGFDFIGVELDPEYCAIAEARIKNVNENKQRSLF